MVNDFDKVAINTYYDMFEHIGDLCVRFEQAMEDMNESAIRSLSSELLTYARDCQRVTYQKYIRGIEAEKALRAQELSRKKNALRQQKYRERHKNDSR